MSSTGTRVVPTLTEILDEQRLAKSSSNLSTEGWLSGRLGDEEIVPISLDWGEAAAASEPGQAEEGAVMTPWQVVQPRTGADAAETPFIDLSIDVAPVRPPALHEQVLEVYAPLPSIAAASAAAIKSPEPGVNDDPLPLPPEVPPSPAAGVLDPGASAVRQGSEHGAGISEERLQAILQQALDRLLRDELPSALVETLIRMSPQLTESLIESLKPSLHLHVMEALSAEHAAPRGHSLS